MANDKAQGQDTTKTAIAIGHARIGSTHPQKINTAPANTNKAVTNQAATRSAHCAILGLPLPACSIKRINACKVLSFASFSTRNTIA